MAHFFDFVVDGTVFFNVGIGGGDVGLGLVVVEVGDKVVDGVIGKKLLELGEELGGEGFIVGEDEGRAAVVLDDVGHGEGLARAGDAK